MKQWTLDDVKAAEPQAVTDALNAGLLRDLDAGTGPLTDRRGTPRGADRRPAAGNVVAKGRRDRRVAAAQAEETLTRPQVEALLRAATAPPGDAA